MTTPTPRLRDEVLAWQAAQPQLRRASRRGIGGVLLTVIGSFGGNGWSYNGRKVTTQTSGDVNRRIGSGRMMRYSIAVDEQAKNLSREERVTLRASGQLPAWFLDTVIAEAKKIKI